MGHKIVELYQYISNSASVIRINCSNKIQVNKVKELFEDLILGKRESSRLSEIWPNRQGMPFNLVFKVLSQRLASKDNLIEKNDALNEYVWFRTIDGWMFCRDMCDGLIDSKGVSGHQYLVDEGESAHIIILSLNEIESPDTP